MHHARIEKSPALQAIYAVLKDRKWHTTLEIMQATSCCTVSTRISELRRNGIEIDCRPKKDAHKFFGGSKVYEYKLISINGSCIMDARPQVAQFLRKLKRTQSRSI